MEVPTDPKEKSIMDAFMELIQYIYRRELLESGNHYLGVHKPAHAETPDSPPPEPGATLEVIYEEDSAIVDQSHDLTISRRFSNKDLGNVDTTNFATEKQTAKAKEGKSMFMKKNSSPKPTSAVKPETNMKKVAVEMLDSTGSQHPRRTPPRRLNNTRDKSDDRVRTQNSPIYSHHRKDVQELPQPSDKEKFGLQNQQMLTQKTKLKAKRDQLKQGLETAQTKETPSLPIKENLTGQRYSANYSKKTDAPKKKETPQMMVDPQEHATNSARDAPVKSSHSTLFGKSETSSIRERTQKSKSPQLMAAEHVRTQIAQERSKFLKQLNKEFLNNL